MNGRDTAPAGAPSRREALQNIHSDQLNKEVNPGLWFEKFLERQPQKQNARGEKDPLDAYFALTQQCSQFEDSNAYRSFFKRWEQTLGKAPQIRTRVISGEGFRLAVGLGNASVIENGLTFHHTYGVPILRGSSLKGLARSYAAKHLAEPWQRSGDAHQTLFGTTKSAGYITFYDALPRPDSWKLLPDIMTVHHQDYYQKKRKDAAPADWDNPIPIPFLAAKGDFLLALSTTPGAESWVEAAFGILRCALEELGIGGKTSSGYGRLEFEATEEEIQAKRFAGDLDQIRLQADALSPSSFASGIGQVAIRLLHSEMPDAAKRPLAAELLERVREAGREAKSAEKGWYKGLVKLVEGGPAV